MAADPAAAPSGVVTFLFTDVEGSTRRWEADADEMRVALAAHDEVMTPLINTSDVDSVESRAMVVLQASAE